MKIAVVLDRFDADVGGLERWAYQLVKWLVGEGHNVHVVAMEFADHGLALDITPHRFEASASRLRRAAAAECCLRSVRADIIHDLGTGWYFDVFQPQFGSRIAGWRQSVRAEPWYGRALSVLSPGRRCSYWSRRQLEKRQLGSPRGIIVAVSRLVEFHLRHLHGVDPGRMRLVYNGVDTEHFTPARRTTDRPVIRAALGLGDADVLFLVAAHNLTLKGAGAALEAFRRVAATDAAARLAFIGRGDSRAYLGAARALGIADRCHFLGFVDDSAKYYSAADVYLHPTFYDPCSLAVLEAWASALPVITTRLNGAAELAIQGQHGFIVSDPRDVQEVAAAMHQLLNPERRAAIAGPARTLALANSSTVNFQRIMRVYESVMAQRVPAGAEPSAARALGEREWIGTDPGC